MISSFVCINLPFLKSYKSSIPISLGTMSYNTITGSVLCSNMMISFMRTLLLLFLFFLLLSLQGFSQEKTITIDDRDVVLNHVGKEEYVEKKKSVPAVKSTDCQYSKNHIDDLQGTTARVLERENLVSHTPEKLKKIYTDKEYFSLDGYLSNYNNNFALFIKITIRTNNPHAAYGSIFKDNKLILRMKNGQAITLYSGQSENGNIDYRNDKSTYMTFFKLDEAGMEVLQSGELEMMRLYWSKGYEDYPVTNPSFFIRQIQCVK